MNLFSKEPSKEKRVHRTLFSDCSSLLNFRIALLTLDFPPRIGGVQQYLFEMSRRIGRHCRLTVVLPRDNRPLFNEEPFQLISVPTSAPWHFARVLAMLRPHITVVGHAHPRLLLAAALLSRGRYIALTYGNDFEAAQSRWHAPVFNRLLAGAHPLVTISRANAQRLQALGLPTPVIVPPGTNPERFRPAATPHSEPPILLTVCRLTPRKGVDTVLQALPRLLEIAPCLQYWVVGDGPARAALERLAQDLQVTHAVRFFGYVSDSALPALYRRASIFVMPTRIEHEAGSVEGFGIVYLEASASGLPVVAARSGGAVEAVREGETGLLAPPNDPTALARALERLINNAVVRQRLGRAGRRWVESEMNWDRAARQFLTIMRGAL